MLCTSNAGVRIKKIWYKQYLSNGDLIKECERKAKFSEEEKYRAVNHYL